MLSPEEFRRYPYFAQAPVDVLQRIALVSSLRKFRAGERLLEEGNQATHLMIVKSGQVDITYRLGDDREVTAESATSGDVISWSAVLAPYRLTASAVASKDGELIQIDGKCLQEMCERESPLGYQLVMEVARGLRDRLSGLRIQLAALR